ncbi:hypothetical protein SCHPADRAFT_878166 [Schizopora paradoxa]|uniref:AAA+ ATPase domain-containing protein n=1 Tax=Schizopora paradoxa TaxID=27342 RepID=A0A0H2RFV7_9AGAM|nr:hypothetical protein SCHPADRAFT_878166 [Schizopora paradoxa]
MAQVATFLPTGLLDDVEPEVLSTEPHSGAEQPQSEGSVISSTNATTKSANALFAPNGLLSEMLDDDEEEETGKRDSGGKVSSFISNGLLSEDMDDDPVDNSQSARQSQIRMDFVQDPLRTASDPPTPSTETNIVSPTIFAPTGLLSDSIDDDADIQLPDAKPQKEQSQSQDDNLPSISDLLQPYRKDTEPSASASSSSYVPFGSISGTTHEGRPIYFRRKLKSKKINAVENRPRVSNLLETPIHRLRQQLAKIPTSLSSLSLGNESQSSSETQLWVDRYRPSRFSDLCGDERVHRETMNWLKEWDSCVFGKKRNNKAKKPFREEADSNFEYKDPFHRPREKILLLSGPAGFGKTTLAHVAAKQAGYDVMEINARRASDSRSGQVVDERIRPTLESGSAIGSKKPVCLVIDEIDGATGAGDNASSFVQKLVALTFEGPRKKTRGDAKGKGKRPLLRPIICICNDLYASSLTKLRQYARIIRFTRPSDIVLTKRLRWICENEGLKAESRALSTLIGIAKGDMRGCLNTLQFIRARKLEVTEAMVRSATVGMKEAESSFSTTLSSLFAPLAKKRVKELGIGEAEENRFVTRLSRDLEDSGSLDRLALGCFEHYTTLRHADATLERHEKGSEWLMTFDSFSGTMRSEREYGLLPYLSYLLVPFYPLFNERGAPKPERPKADWENLMKTRASEEIYKSMRGCLQSNAGQRFSGIRHLLANENLQLEFAPYINRIISPPLRPINSQVTKPKDRAILNRLVEIMVSLELRLVQDKAEDGQLVYLLDPPIDAFITYDSKRATDIPVARYATRHLIAGEIDAQIIQQQADAVEKASSSKKKFDMFSRNRKQKDGEDETGDPGSSPSRPGQPGNAKRKAAELDIADRPPVDFFGRPIESTAPKSKKLKGQDALVQKAYRVSFKYNEGNSAAVRKPLKMSSFI